MDKQAQQSTQLQPQPQPTMSKEYAQQILDNISAEQEQAAHAYIKEHKQNYGDFLHNALISRGERQQYADSHHLLHQLHAARVCLGKVIPSNNLK